MTVLRVLVLALAISCAGCAAHKYDYACYGQHFPASILIAPPLNRTAAPTAPATVIASLVMPLADRGYYVFPVPLALETLDKEGLADALAIRETPTEELYRLTGADAVLYVTIERWETYLQFFSPRAEVALAYVLRDARTGIVLWENRSHIVYSPNTDASLYGTTTDYSLGFGGTAGTGWTLTYIELAEEANRQAINKGGRGLPYGRYSPRYGKDWASYPDLAPPGVHPAAVAAE